MISVHTHCHSSSLAGHSMDIGICEIPGTHLHASVNYELMRQPVHELWPLKLTLPHQHVQLLVIPVLRLPITQPIQILAPVQPTQLRRHSGAFVISPLSAPEGEWLGTRLTRP